MKTLVDLRDLAARGDGVAFRRRIEALRERRGGKPALIRRLRDAGL